MLNEKIDTKDYTLYDSLVEFTRKTEFLVKKLSYYQGPRDGRKD